MTNNFGITKSGPKVIDIEQLMGCSEELVINIGSDSLLQLTLKKSNSKGRTFPRKCPEIIPERSIRKCSNPVNNISESMSEESTSFLNNPLRTVRQSTRNDSMFPGCMKSRLQKINSESDSLERMRTNGNTRDRIPSRLQPLSSRRQVEGNGDKMSARQPFTRTKCCDNSVKGVNSEDSSKLDLFAYIKTVEQKDSQTKCPKNPCGVKENTKIVRSIIDDSFPKPKEDKDDRKEENSNSSTLSDNVPVKSSFPAQKNDPMPHDDGSPIHFIPTPF